MRDGRHVAEQSRARSDTVGWRTREAMELFGAHEVPALLDVLIQCCLDALIK